MHLKPTLLLASLALALACAGPARAADQHLVVGANPASFRVIDLTPNDGIAAGFTVGPATTSLSVSVSDYYLHSDWDQAVMPNGQAGTIHAGLAGLQTAASVDAAGASQASYTMLDHLSIDGYTSSIIEQTLQLTLHANSLLVLDGSVFALSDNIAETETSISAFTRVILSDGTLNGIHNEFVASRADWQTADYVTPFTLTYANFTDADMTVTMDVNTRLSVTAAVPEPSTWAMLLGGLAATGVFVRRRARAA